MLWFRLNSLFEKVTGFDNVVQHVDLDYLLVIVLAQVDSKEYVAVPIDCAYIFLGKMLDEVSGIILIIVAYTKVINN